jgi:hypothetical protein
MARNESGTAAADLERGLLHRRGALHAGHRAERVCAPIPAFASGAGHRHFHTVLAKAELGVFAAAVVRPVPPALRRKYFMRSRDPDSDRCGWFRNCGGWSSFAV